jgi:hypothetical protein
MEVNEGNPATPNLKIVSRNGNTSMISSPTRLPNSRELSTLDKKTRRLAALSPKCAQHVETIVDVMLDELEKS